MQVCRSLGSRHVARGPDARGRGARRRRADRPRPGRSGAPRAALSRAAAAAGRPSGRRARKAGLQRRRAAPATAPDLRGGDMGGPNLLRSDVMLNDENGELLLADRQGQPGECGHARDRAAARPTSPRSPLTSTACSPPHARRARRRRATAVALNVLVGDAAAGQALFQREMCLVPFTDRRSAGHRPPRVPMPMQLQNLWVGGGRSGPNATDESARAGVT